MPIHDITSYLIKQKYIMIKTSCELNCDMDKVYSLTPHPIRYTCLSYLKLLSLPISLAFYVTKLCFTANPVWTWIGGNILYKKMDQAIAKKILHGLPDAIETDQNIPKIVEYVFKNYEENPTLAPLIEPTFIQKFLAKADQYIPIFSKIIKFWNAGGINYSDEIQTKRELIDVIYKQIVSKAYEVGKKGGKLEITDVKALFPKINFEAKVNAESENLQIDKVEVSNRPISSDQKYEEVNTNPLMNLIMLKVLHDGVCQEVQKVYIENYLAEYQICNHQEILKNAYIEDYLARLQLYGNYNYDNNTYISEQPVLYLGQNYEHLTAPISCY
ncbi:MAG: DNA-binding protein [Rickettsia endosymbiont of Ixodes persulcatus]|nr:DNA-binding protein [Rickettsia endosymbiont of Ixodes persulcatus]MCZ6903755.1 DNA-binding protein [Rickettsia endosymbiont of Ixodes persulcatus]MCZ6909373.1 DNA-binding protein [Rickettsia endosymbiont of Ixodes persulcatus]MCZ6909620.1 DNA-binding protein [Rickettsia endosymbiont of Ixodes persulcatus]MCZ6914482.1 DNA-binding protein [Rickettsia endosymbiont of Ixodes persulcatus]